MNIKGTNFLFAFLIILPNMVLAQEVGEISINQNFRKPVENSAEAPSYAPYYPSQGDEKQISEAPKKNVVPEPLGPIVDPPLPAKQIDQERVPEIPRAPEPSVIVEPVIPPPAPQIRTPEPTPTQLPAYGFNSGSHEPIAPSVVVAPRPQIIQGPAPSPQLQESFPSAVAQRRPQAPAATQVRIPTLTSLRGFTWRLSQENVEYKFGRNSPAFGGLDSSGSVQFILKETGLIDVPRTTSGLNSWIRESGALREFRSRPTVDDLTNSLIPGNLIFWGDPQSRKLTHVMIYMGYDVQRGHLAFGTRGGTENGINNSEVDIFPLYLDRERIISTGRVPGLHLR